MLWIGECRERAEEGRQKSTVTNLLYCCPTTPDRGDWKVSLTCRHHAHDL